MGSSSLVGGISTFLGTLPLAFSSSEIFTTIFIAFLGLATLACAHSLILLPVILSTIGPEDQIEKGAAKSLEHQETTATSNDHVEHARRHVRMSDTQYIKFLVDFVAPNLLYVHR
jgi:predicted RND superfamily exporter protein